MTVKGQDLFGKPNSGLFPLTQTFIFTINLPTCVGLPTCRDQLVKYG